MNKAQAKAREENIQELQLAYPGLKDAAKLQDGLYRLALRTAHNASMLCSDPDWEDRRDEIRAEVKKLANLHGVELQVELNGDPRGFALKLRLPTGRSNSFGGEVWGIA